MQIMYAVREIYMTCKNTKLQNKTESGLQLTRYQLQLFANIKHISCMVSIKLPKGRSAYTESILKTHFSGLENRGRLTRRVGL